MNGTMRGQEVIPTTYSQERLNYMAFLLRKQGDMLSKKGYEDSRGQGLGIYLVKQR